MRFKCVFICFILLLILHSCKTADLNNNTKILYDNKYDSESPSVSISNELGYISKTVKKLDVLAFYSNHFFPQNSNITKSMLNDSIIKTYSNNTTITNESVLGTASIIYANDGIIGLLTCAHVVDFKDTVFTYYKTGTKSLSSVSIKIRQQNHVGSLELGEPIEIIAIDKKLDIALLMKKDIPFNKVTPVLNYSIGDINDLQWGSLVYIMGYPLGNLMVTSGITSISNKMKSGIFVTDALYNHGISGSPVFAIRDGVPNFELIGMATSAAAQGANIIVADDKYESKPKIKTPYDGNLFIDNTKLISYGVTYSISINEIVTFIHLNEDVISSHGFNTNNFFK